MSKMRTNTEVNPSLSRGALCLRPCRVGDGEKIVTWCTDETAYYKWSAGRLGPYPLTPSRFNQALAARENGYSPFVLEEGGEAVGFFILRQPGENPEELRFGFVILILFFH